MSKKHGFIFLSLGLLLLLMFGLYNYTNLFTGEDESSSSNEITPNPNETPSSGETIKYDYIKSHDINAKVKLSYPLYEKLEVSDQNTSEFNRVYINGDGLSLNASIYSDSGSVEDYAKKSFNNYKKEMEQSGYTVSSDDISCKYLCKKYIINKDSIILNEYRIFIKISTSDVAEIVYRSKDRQIHDDLIKKTAENVKKDNTATYMIGNIDGDKLTIELLSTNSKSIIVSLDKKIYEEIEDKLNTTNRTIIVNKANNSKIILKTRSSAFESTIDKDLDFYYGVSNGNSIKKEIKVDDVTFYEYKSNNITNYAYLIDNNNALLIEAEEGTININDFSKIIK